MRTDLENGSYSEGSSLNFDAGISVEVPTKFQGAPGCENEPVAPQKNTKKGDGVLSDVELNTILDQIEFIRKLTACDTKEEFFQQICSIVKNFGFTDCSFVRVRENGGFDVRFSSLPEEF